MWHTRQDTNTLYTKTFYTEYVLKLSPLWAYNLSHILNFDKSVKEVHEPASGVPKADLTTTRSHQTSHNRYFF